MYTWGQIRLLLQQFAPGASLDAIDEKINARYALILSLLEWKGLEKSSVLVTMPAITAGTISVTEGSTAVSGTGTNWTSAITGMQLFLPGQLELYTVTCAGATALTLDRPFQGSTNPAMGYTLLQSIYRLPPDCRQLRVITSPATGLALDEKTEVQFAELIGSPDLLGAATMYIPQPDATDPQTGQKLQQIQLFPLPTRQRSYPLVYEQAAAGFDGVSTAARPMDFISDAALLAGCKADLELEKDTPNLARAEAFEASFDKHVQGMLHVENRKRVARPPRMNPRYTRHRAVRILRNYGGAILLGNDYE